MPTEQPSNAPDTVEPRDADTAAAVLRDDHADTTPGGGGLGGASAADPLAGAAGAATPNSPIDAPVPPTDDDLAAEHQARVEASRADPTEPHPGSM